MAAHRRPGRALRGTDKRTQRAPVLAYVRPPEGELNEDQKALMRLRPKHGLTFRQKLYFARQVKLAPWLGPNDIELLLMWVHASDRYRAASMLLDTLMADPGFNNPKSAIAKNAISCSRTVHRELMTMLTLAHRLGFSPSGMLALGVETRPPAASADENNPWASLRLVRKD